MCAQTAPIISVIHDDLNFTSKNALEYLQEYYSRAAKDTYFVLAYLDREGHFVQKIFKIKELYEHPTAVKEFIEANIDKNLYYSINTFKSAKRSAREVVNILALAFDFDLHRPVSEEELQKILGVIEDFEQQTGIKTTIVKSGGGVQLMLLPSRPLHLSDFLTKEQLQKLYSKYGPELHNADEELTKEATENYRKIMSILAERFEQEFDSLGLEVEVDHKVFEFARVMRLPHTYNIKYNAPVPTTLIQYNIIEYELVLSMVEQLLHMEKKVREEENKNEVLLAELDESTTKQIAIELSDELKEFYIKGRRHFIALAIAGYMRKYTNIDEESAKKIIETFAQLLYDEEVKDRVLAVETTYKKKVSEVSAFSILATVFSEDEFEEFTARVKGVFERHAITKLNTHVYSLVEKTLSTKKFVTMNSGGMKLITVRYDEDEKIKIKETLIAFAEIEIVKIIRLFKNNTVMTLYDVNIKDTIAKQKISLKEKTIREIADTMRDLGLSVVSPEKLTNYLTAILKRLEELRDIKIVYVYYSFDIEYVTEHGYTMTPPTKLKRIIDSGADLNSIDINKVYKILNNIKDREKLFVLLASSVASAFSKTDNLLRPIVLLEGERGTGKTTLARFFTSVAFLNAEGSNDTLLSEFRTIELLTQSYTPVLIDDAEMQRTEVQKLLKSYATGTYIVRRGRSNLKVEEYELKNTIIITSNNFYINDDALKSRVIVLRTDEKTFKTEEAAFETENPELRGWGYLLLEKVVNWLNERGKRFSELVFEEYKTINLEDRRRARIYAQLFAALRILVEVIEHEELAERLARIYENKAGIIKLIEANQTTDAESMMLDTILQIIARDEEVQQYVFTEYKNDRAEKYVTAAALKLIERKYNIKISLRQLADMLNTRTTTKTIDNHITKVVKISDPGLARYL